MAKTLRKLVCLVYLLTLIGAIAWAMPAQADGGFAMSGSFNAQKLELPQGTILRTPDIYVVIFNNSSSDFNVRMTTNVPIGVTLVLSEYDFLLKANTQKKIEVGVDVGTEAAPGQYKIGIIAETYHEGAEGIQIVGAAGQEADLTVTGESGTVDITTVSPDGTPVPARIVLSRKSENTDFEIARIETGRLELTVSPGTYIARAYVAGIKLAEETFTVDVDEHKVVQLTVKTVYFEGFEIVPNYQQDTDKLEIVEIVYAVNNLLESFESAQVTLNVGYNQSPLKQIPLIKFAPLDKGKVELSYTYQPSDGWAEGVYSFALELEVNGKVYTTSPTKELTVDKKQANKPAVTDDGSGKTGTSATTWVIIAVAAVVVLAGINVFFLMRRRKK